MATTTASKPRAKRKLPARPVDIAPGITKRSLTLAEAAEQFERATRAIDENKPLREEAAKVLLDHFAKTGRSTYKDRIALTIGAARLVLDQARVREFLGKRLSEFQTRTKPSRSLTLLK